MKPTENYFTFSLSRQLGQTVAELLTGKKMPVSAMELYLWARYDLATARLRQQGKR